MGKSMRSSEQFCYNSWTVMLALSFTRECSTLYNKYLLHFFLKQLTGWQLVLPIKLVRDAMAALKAFRANSRCLRGARRYLQQAISFEIYLALCREWIVNHVYCLFNCFQPHYIEIIYLSRCISGMWNFQTCNLPLSEQCNFLARSLHS